MVMLNNGYLSLIRQPSKYIYHMDYAVNIGYGDGYGLTSSRSWRLRRRRQAGPQTRGDQAGPGLGRPRVEQPEDSRPRRDPRGPRDRCLHGVSIDKIVERDPIIDIPADAPVKEPAAVR